MDTIRLRLSITAFLVVIIAANINVALFGPAAILINAGVLVAFDFTIKDVIQDAWNRQPGLWLKMLALVGTGSVLSAILTIAGAILLGGRLELQDTFIALASFVAFLSSGLLDAGTYQKLIRHPWLYRVNSSNLAGVTLDSLVFVSLAHWLAWGWPGWVTVLSLAGGQVLVKLAGGVAWSLILWGLYQKVYILGR